MATVQGSFVYSPAAGTVLSAGICAVCRVHTQRCGRLLPCDADDYDLRRAGYPDRKCDRRRSVRRRPHTGDGDGDRREHGAGPQPGGCQPHFDLLCGASAHGIAAQWPPNRGGHVLGGGQLPRQRRLHFRHGAGHFHDHSGHAVGDLERTRPNRLRHGAGAAQLDATANVQGSFAYSPAAGTVLGVGVHTLSVVFTPNDTVDYSSVTETTAITVTQSAFVKEDTTTEGNWIGTYGSQGYDIVGGPSSEPSYVTVTPEAESTCMWTSTSSQEQALEIPDSSNRLAACWFSSNVFTINVDFTDDNTHALALYALDYDDLGRSEQIQIQNASTGAVLDTSSISNFANGVYLQWDVSGDVVITVTCTAGKNAVIGGLFFDAGPTTASASYVKTDTATEGNWIGTYGSQGYDIVGGPSSEPSYVTVTPEAESTCMWTSTSSQEQALEIPNSSNRLAACWFSSNVFTINVDFTDGNTHALALYALDYDDLGRSEQIQIQNASTGAVLDTSSISNFANGVYLQWDVSGDVVITVTCTAGKNAVIGGLFFDAGPTTASASYVKTDTATEGNWIGTYGSQGYDIVGGPSSEPSYVTVTPEAESTCMWTSTSSQEQALEIPNSSNRLAACWFSSNVFTINVDFTDDNTHALALYALDYDDLGRSEQIQIQNASTGAVLDTSSISNFANGVYLQWDVSGDVVITVTCTAGKNAVIGGLFFDAGPTTASASYVKTDTATEGNWIGTYGSQGYDIVGGPSSEPSYVTVTPEAESTCMWTSTSSQEQALEIPNSSNRLAACWFSSNVFTINVDFTDGNTHALALYALDYDDLGRSEQIQIQNASTGAVLDTSSISNFANGVYLQWDVSGDVVITVRCTAGKNAVIGGLFIDPDPAAGAAASAIESATSASAPGTVIGNSTQSSPGIKLDATSNVQSGLAYNSPTDVVFGRRVNTPFRRVYAHGLRSCHCKLATIEPRLRYRAPSRLRRAAVQSGLALPAL